MAKLVNMRGLQTFIADIRNCANKEQEKVRVDKELGKIRKKFASGNTVTEYDKKKYVWKLLYIYMLGYEVEFGHKQAADLIPATKYAEKQVGYMACAILLNEKDEFLRLIINSIRNDLISRNEAFHCLALGFVGNVGGQEMAALLMLDVMNLLTSGAVRPIVRKKAALCLLRLIRKAPPESEVMPPDVWAAKLGALLDERDTQPGVLLALVTLLLGIVSRSYEGYEGLAPRVVRLLERLVPDRREGGAAAEGGAAVGADYHYYGIPSPWLQVKCLRVLQYFPPPEDAGVLRALTAVLRRIIAGSDPHKNVNKNNAQHAVVFEAIALALALEADAELLSAGVALLARFISVREPNIKYLGLENLVRLAEVPAVADTIARHQQSVIASLRDADVSIRRRGLDLLFAMCNRANAPDIVAELLRYLEVADYGMREELVLKAAVLAERFYPDLRWYVDVMLQLIERAGEFASKDVWHSTVQLITAYPELHEYSTRKALEALQRGAAHEALVCCAGYLLGEYGRLVADVPAHMQFALLQERFVAASSEAKGLLLTTYMKLLVADPGDAALREGVQAVFERYARFMDADLQQRAAEYLALGQRPDVAARNVAAMPPWEKRKSLLLRRMAEREGEDADEAQARPAWLQAEEDGAAAPGTPGPGPPPAGAAAPGLAPSGGSADFVGLAQQPHANGHMERPGAPPPAAAPAPAAPRNPLDDLLSLSPADAPPPPPPAAQVAPAAPHQPPAAAADPFSVSGDAHALTGGPPAEPRPLGDVDAWHRKLCLAPSGVLYEDAHLQIGVKMQFQGSQGQLALFLGNKGDAELERLVCALPPVPQFAFQVGPVPRRLEPKKQIQVPLMVACVAPFAAPPRLQLGYARGGQALSRSLALPVVVSKFCTPPDAPVPREAFFQRWRALPGPPQRLGERVVRATPVPRAPVEGLLAALGLGVQAGLDPDPDNAVAVATFTCAPPGQPAQQVPCMVRVEVEKTQRLQFQVTVASPDATVTAALKDLICQLLASM